MRRIKFAAAMALWLLIVVATSAAVLVTAPFSWIVFAVSPAAGDAAGRFILATYHVPRSIAMRYVPPEG